MVDDAVLILLAADFAAVAVRVRAAILLADFVGADDIAERDDIVELVLPLQQRRNND